MSEVPCQFTYEGNVATCTVCGRSVKTRTRHVHATCRVQPKPGLGDLIKAGLSAIGITEERVSEAIGRPCGCGRRVEALNRWGTKFGLPPGQT